MRMVDIIDTKRNGGVLSDEQLQFFVDGVVNGTIPDYQISALLMAIYPGYDQRRTDEPNNEDDGVW